MMKIIYSQQPIPNRINKSIFLAGCTAREDQELTWRKEAINFLESIGYDGVIFVPEFEDTSFNTTDAFDYGNQIEWEDKCLSISDKIIFWIPRNLESNILGLTSNFEMGKWMSSNRVVLGFPPNADKMRYLIHHAEKLNIPIYNKLICLDICCRTQGSLNWFFVRRF